MSISVPTKIPVPWATSGLKNTIPATSDPVTGLAGYDQGFTAINMTPRTAGGIPPFGQDFNGIFYAVTEALRYLETGALFPYDGTFATAVGGYPIGSLLQRTDSYGLWRNISANNTTDPEAFGAGWIPEGSGIATVAMSNANVTLTALQAARNIIVITGTLTANINLIFPTYQKQWLVVNSASGAFSVTCKTASGSGVAIATGGNMQVYGDGTNIVSSSIQFASTAEAQAFTVTNKAISPSTLSDAFKGANISLAANGYQKLPSGVILQWGTASIAATGSYVSLPVAFPSAFTAVMTSMYVAAAPGVTANNNVGVQAQPDNLTRFVARCYQDGLGVAKTVTWFAVGY